MAPAIIFKGIKSKSYNFYYVILSISNAYFQFFTMHTMNSGGIFKQNQRDLYQTYQSEMDFS